QQQTSGTMCLAQSHHTDYAFTPELFCLNSATICTQSRLKERERRQHPQLFSCFCQLTQEIPIENPGLSIACLTGVLHLGFVYERATLSVTPERTRRPLECLG